MRKTQKRKKLERLIEELNKLKVISPTVEPPPNILSQNQVFCAGQMNVLLRMSEIIEKFNKPDTLSRG